MCVPDFVPEVLMRPVVLPVSQRLKDRVFGDAYEERVAAHAATLHLRLAGELKRGRGDAGCAPAAGHAAQRRSG